MTQSDIKYKNLRLEINTGLQKVVTDNFPQNLYNPMKYVLSAEGKRLRPILLMFACEAAGSSFNKSFEAALAIEILHNFTLVHDDIMDEDDLRRGRETVHKKWNNSIAILAGDGLIALAYRCLLKTESKNIQNIVKIFSEAIIVVCEGQSLDKDLELKDHAKIDEYSDMICRKTATLMSVSTEIGAIVAGADEKVVEALKNFGMELGMAFQIQDDLLDIYSEEEVLGKDLGSDLKMGKKTYPLIIFNDCASKEDKIEFADLLQNTNGTDFLKSAKSILDRSQIVAKTVSEVSCRIDKAIEHLDSVKGKINPQNLLFITDKIKNRKF